MTKFPCYIEFSESGKLAEIVHKNKRVLARLVIDGDFAARCARMHLAHDAECPAFITRSNPNRGKCICGRNNTKPFRAEVIQLEDSEIIDTTSESIVELETK